MMASLLTHLCVTRPQWVDKTNNTTIQRNQLLHTSSIFDASVNRESHLIFMWMLVILLTWFHSAVARICNVNAAGVIPNNMIKFYDAIHMASSASLSERMCYIETLKIVLHAACQCKQVNRTSGDLEQRVLWGVLLIGCSPDSKNGFFLYWLLIWKFCTKDDRNVHCKISNKLDHGEIVMEKFCGAIVAFQFWLNEFRFQSRVALVSGL